MRHALRQYDEHEEDWSLAQGERSDEQPPRDRRLVTVLVSIFAMVLFAGGLWFAYVQGTKRPALSTTVGSDGVPLIRADDRPTKMKPEQPGGMAIPDQNVSLYGDKLGAPGGEKLLPAPEQPMPRPAAPPKEVAFPPPTAPAAEEPAPAAPGNAAAIAPKPEAAKPAPKTAAAKPEKPGLSEAEAIMGKPAHPQRIGAVQVQLGSLKSPEAAKEQWERLKRDNGDILGKVTAVAVKTDLGDKGTFYRIQAGPFADAAAAEKVCGELKRRNLGCILAR